MIIDVAVPVRVPGTFHYLLKPEQETEIQVGSVVEIPFKNRKTHGFVVGFPTQTTIDPKKLKEAETVLVSESLFDSGMLDFLKWVSEYYHHPLGEVIATAIPKTYWERKKKVGKEVKAEAITSERVPEPELTLEQASAMETLLNSEEKRPVLIQGVTGSGKTELYIRVIEKALEQSKSAILLAPEIALTPQLLDRFRSRFHAPISVLHSDMSNKERFNEWERIRTGVSPIVIGARSAIFAPVKNLGVIVVDEEHETTYKQEDSLRYNARDLAVVRGNMNGARVILGSATPSLESYANAKSGKYAYVQLRERVGKRPLPKTVFVDIKDPMNAYSPQFPWISRVLVSRLKATFAAKQQALLYLNRLGFSHFLYCTDCGHTWRCLNCDVALTYYQNPPEIRCHYCGLHQQAPTQCTECKGTKLKAIGLGTEQVEKQMQVLFPDVRIGRMDRSNIKNRKDLEAFLRRIQERDLDLVIGTQMVTKGHDFPGISLVGVLLADASLNLPDFRASERTFQILTQVSGRAGRADVPGEVIVQTVNPEHPILKYAANNELDLFYKQELESRKAFRFPPHQRLAMLRFQHKNQNKVRELAESVTALIRRDVTSLQSRCTIVGPAEAPLSRLKNMYRWQILLKAESVRDLQKIFKTVQEFIDASKQASYFGIDMDPMTAL